jgi:stage II sporulation protein D
MRSEATLREVGVRFMPMKFSLLCLLAFNCSPSVSIRPLVQASTPAVIEASRPPYPSATEQSGFDPQRAIAVRLMEGAEEVTFSSEAVLLIGPKGAVPIELGAQQAWKLTRRNGAPARLVARIQVGEVAFGDEKALQQLQQQWSQRGMAVSVLTVGTLYSVGTVRIDNRKRVVLLDETYSSAEALTARQSEVLSRFSVRTAVFEVRQQQAEVEMELFNAFGQSVAVFKDSVTLRSQGAAPIAVKQVEFGVGYDFHSFEDRSYRGDIRVCADKLGKLAIVNDVDLESLMKGLVPSEIFAKAHPEALKAQAVTARSEVLAKLKTKHLVDPYLLCSEQHCAVYKGVSAERKSTNDAVDATRGEALFSKTGDLVDTVYSAVCGGHTESNEFAWGTTPNAHLRGRPDTLGPTVGYVSPQNLRGFLDQNTRFACRLSSFAQPAKLRWEKRFTAAEANALVAPFAIGRLMAMTVVERGVSGRATILTLSGDQGAHSIRGELAIRRLFGNLDSALFEVRASKDARGDPTGWVFEGAGWGHGVGMCQTGAIGRAESGHRYREILAHYFSDAQVAKMY